MMRRRWIVSALKILFCIGIMSWILSRADLALVTDAMVGANRSLIALALGMQVLGACIITLRWRRLLAVKQVTPGFSFLFLSMMSSFFFRQFLPSVFGGDTIRGYDSWRAGASPTFAVLTLVVDRLFGLTALVLFAIFAGFARGDIARDLPGLWLWTAMALVILLILLVVIAFPRRVPLPRRAPRKISQIVEALSIFSGKSKLLWGTFGLSVLLQINVVTFYFVIACSLGFEMPYSAFFIIVPVATFAMMLPVSINGIGIRETVFIFLLGIWGVDEASALAFAWIEFGLILCLGLIGGGIYMMRRGPKSPRDFQIPAVR